MNALGIRESRINVYSPPLLFTVSTSVNSSYCRSTVYQRPLCETAT